MAPKFIGHLPPESDRRTAVHQCQLSAGACSPPKPIPLGMSPQTLHAGIVAVEASVFSHVSNFVNVAKDFFHALSEFELAEHEWPAGAHPLGVAPHQF